MLVCHHERNPRRFWELKDHPYAAQRRVGRPRDLLRRVALRASILVDSVRLQLVEDKFVEEDVVRNGCRAPKTAAALVVDEDRLEARSMSVEKELATLAVVERRASQTIPEQGTRMTLKHSHGSLEVVAAHVDTHSLLSTSVKRTTMTEQEVKVI